ncbi:MAG: DUF4270 family protein [Flavitalea sp.]
MFEKIIVVGKYLVLVLFIFLLADCTKDPQYIETVTQDPNLFIVQTDTLQPAFIVYKLDSFQTSGSNKAIIGETTDPYFGKTTSKSYLRFKIASNYYGSVGSASETFDSIALIMHTDHRFYGDTNSIWNIEAHELRENLDAVNKNYFNQQSLLTVPTAMGTASIKIRPNVDDSVSVKLSDDFGAEVFNLYKKADSRIFTQDDFQQFFRGLSIEPSAGNNVTYSFNATDSGTTIRLYYHDDQGVHINKTLDFKSEGGSFQFNSISNDPTGTITETLLPGHELLSSTLGNQIYINDLAGVGTKFTLPSLKALPTLPDFVRIETAELQVLPVPQSFAQFPLINFIGLGISVDNGSTLSPVYTADKTSIQNGGLTFDDLKGTGTDYRYDLSAFTKVDITSTIYTTGTIYLQPFSAANGREFSLNRLVAGDDMRANSPSKFLMQLLFFKK